MTILVSFGFLHGRINLTELFHWIWMDLVTKGYNLHWNTLEHMLPYLFILLENIYERRFNSGIEKYWDASRTPKIS